MRVAILTRSVPPAYCGIGDYTIYFAEALRKAGKHVQVFAGRGEPSSFLDIVPDQWNFQGLSNLLHRLEEEEIEHLVLQFTPLAFNTETDNTNALVFLWSQCSKRWKTSLVIHETYFITRRYAPSWIRGWKEKAFLHKMVQYSHFVFTASQPLVYEIRGWGFNGSITRMPIGSNFPLVKIDRHRARLALGIAPDEVLLVLFGGGTSLKWMRKHIFYTDDLLHSKGIRAKWLLLGGISASWFNLKLPANFAPRLSQEEISVRLQTSDIFLMPHYAGLCAKRGTLMAAMQHSLPVIGTRTHMTDNFWKSVEGIRLVPRNSKRSFFQEVILLARDQNLRETLGKSNQRYFFRNFTWDTIVQIWLDATNSK